MHIFLKKNEKKVHHTVKDLFMNCLGDFDEKKSSLLIIYGNHLYPQLQSQSDSVQYRVVVHHHTVTKPGH